MDISKNIPRVIPEGLEVEVARSIYRSLKTKLNNILEHQEKARRDIEFILKLLERDVKNYE